MQTMRSKRMSIGLSLGVLLAVTLLLLSTMLPGRHLLRRTPMGEVSRTTTRKSSEPERAGATMWLAAMRACFRSPAPT